MNTSLYALEKIKNVYVLRYDTAKAKLSHLEKEFANAQKQLDDINLYYEEYCKTLTLQSANGLNINQLKNHHGFVNQFIPVISHQKSIITNIYNTMNKEKSNLIKCYKDLKAIEHILEKKNEIILNELVKRETLAQEETLVNIQINKKSL